MKKLIFILAFSLFSCKSFNDYRNQEVTISKEASQSFDIENNILTIKAEINNESGNFLFDTGAQSSVITDSIFLKKIKTTENNLIRSMRVKGANGTLVESYKFISTSANSVFFSSKNKIFRFLKINHDSKLCQKKSSLHNGIIGFDMIKNSPYPILLDFENHKIRVMNEMINLNEYQESNAKINLLDSKITLPITINNKEIDFLFDTGNNSGLVVKQKDFPLKEKPNQEAALLITTIGGTSVQNIKTYFNVAIKSNHISSTAPKVTVLEKLITNTLGINFIKNYNWILDFKNKKVYFKKLNQTPTETTNTTNPRIQCIAINNKLLIGLKPSTDSSKFKVGDEIISVNNEPVTNENLCNIEESLNASSDWNSFKIETKGNLMN